MTLRLDLEPPPPAPPPVLDAEQRAVVAHEHGPLLVLAGPGTGKTTTIVEAVVARLAAGTAPDAVLALTFGRKAAGELRDRVVARLGGGLAPVVATFHSFAYALLRQTADAQEYLTVPRLMSGAEEDVRIRDLLRGAVQDGVVDWPDELAGALPTLGLAAEMRTVLARARTLGLDGADLEEVGLRSGRPMWVAAGQFGRHEEDVLALEDVMDYGELLVQAVGRARLPHVRAVLQERYRAIYVDEYQDTDPLQVDLLRALVGPSTALVVVGDPDQSIYAFRGADVGGLLRFPEQFRAAGGAPAPVVVLGHTRRFGPQIRAAAAATLGPRLPGRLPARVLQAHREPTCVPVPDPATDDLVTVRTYDDRGAQAAHIAHELRQAHLHRGVPWDELAVLARTGGQLAGLQRTLSAAGVPVVVAADEIPLRAEPAVAALLAAMALAVDPKAAAPVQVADVVVGPLAALSAGDVRRLGRALRLRAHEDGFAAPPSDRLIRDLVVESVRARSTALDLPFDPDDPICLALGRLVAILVAAGDQDRQAAGPAQVLWTLWSGGATPHGWPERLRAAALAGSTSAGHDLDAVMALFAAAERLVGRYHGVLGVRAFLDSLADQQIPAEPVAAGGTHAQAVRLLTAHRAKGLEWDEVWLVGLEEGCWPDLRARGSTLRAQELTATGIGTGARPGDLLAEERRLAYVASTRARRRLHVTAIDAPGEGGERRSRFVDDLAAAGMRPQAVSGRPPHPLTLDGLVTRLRIVGADPNAPEHLRQAAAGRLAVLAAAVDPQGRPVAPLARPSTWWGLRDVTAGSRPVRASQDPVAMSGSGLDAIVGCPLKWFLEHEVSAQSQRGTATGFGSIVHAIADFVAKGEVPAEVDAADAQADRVWPDLRFEASWQSAAERAQARAAVARFLAYHERADRTLVGTEVAVAAEIEVPTPDGPAERVRLTGYIDRIEADADGRVVPIDLKNMRTPPRDTDIPEHGQLGVYQLLVQDGGWTPADDRPISRPIRSGGAALVQLRADTSKTDPSAKVQLQPALPADGPSWVTERLGQAAQIIRSERFDAIVGPACRYCALKQVCPAQAVGTAVTS